MKLLEIFSGTQSISKVFRSHGWETFTIDNDKKFVESSWITDILEVTADDIIQRFGKPDVIWASCPCTAFSVASMGFHWQGGFRVYEPKTEFAKLSKKIVQHTLQLIKDLEPKYFFIENPRGVLRKMPFMEEFPRYSVTYCQYGDFRMKPTDIWTNVLDLPFRPMCSNGSGCHESAPRGSSSGTQGMKNAKERSKIPQSLCEHIFEFSSNKQRFIPVSNFNFTEKQMDIFDFVY
jgi:hypothetical protein